MSALRCEINEYEAGLVELALPIPGAYLWVVDLSLIDIHSDSYNESPAMMVTKPTQSSAPLAGNRWRDLGRQITRRLLAAHLGLNVEQIAFQADRRDRMTLDIERMPPSRDMLALDFNTARRGHALVVGLCAGGRIGVDIELVEPERDLSAALPAGFTDQETRQIAALPTERRLRVFYQCWTAKEAFVKAIGLGAAFGLEKVETSLGADGTMRISSVAGSTQLAQSWNLTHHTIETRGWQFIVAAITSRSPGVFHGHGQAGSNRSSRS